MSVPALVVDVDRTIRRDGVNSRLRARYAVLDADTVHTVAVLDDRVESRRLTIGDWRGDLDRLARVPGYAEPSTPPREELDLPWGLIVGTGRALAEHRPELYAELVAREDPRLGPPLHRLHVETVGRLRVVGILPARRRVGWISWVLYADGWRALTPYVEEGRPAPRPTVRLEPRRAEDLALEVARWAAEVAR
jgi:hypothetical protein